MMPIDRQAATIVAGSNRRTSFFWYQPYKAIAPTVPFFLLQTQHITCSNVLEQRQVLFDY